MKASLLGHRESVLGPATSTTPASGGTRRVAPPLGARYRTWRSHALALLVGGLLAAAVASGCDFAGVRVEPTSSGTAQTVVAAPSATSSVPNESPSPSGTWGPLAVVPPQGGTDTARAEGTLRITDECVFLVWAGRRELLVWPADRTRWNPRTRTITFTNFDGSTVSVSDGMQVVLGGGGDSNEESGTTTEEWLARTQWIARPADSCPLDSRWWVGVVER